MPNLDQNKSQASWGLLHIKQYGLSLCADAFLELRSGQCLTRPPFMNVPLFYTTQHKDCPSSVGADSGSPGIQVVCIVPVMKVTSFG